MPIYNPAEKMKVPDVLFYENAQVSTNLLTSELQKFVKCVVMGMLICVIKNVLTKF